MSVRKRTRFLSLNLYIWTVWGQWELWSRGPKLQQLWGWGRFWRRARGVTPATRLTNNQRSRVQQFIFFKCLWWRGNFSEWATSTGPNTIHFTVDMAPWPHSSVVHALEGAPGAKRQWTATFKMMAAVHLVVSCCILWKLSRCWWWRLSGTRQPPWQNWRRTFASP